MVSFDVDERARQRRDNVISLCFPAVFVHMLEAKLFCKKNIKLPWIVWMKGPDKDADYVSSNKLSHRNFPSSKEQLLGRNALLEKEVAVVHNQGLDKKTALAHFFLHCAQF